MSGPRSAVSVVGGKAGSADQRSSKLAVGNLFALPFSNVVPETAMPSVQGECDLMAAALAATASRVTVTKPVIVRCFIRTSSGPQSPLFVVTGTSRRFNGDATSIDHENARRGQRSYPTFKMLLSGLANRGCAGCWRVCPLSSITGPSPAARATRSSRSTKPSGYDLRPHIPVFRGRLPVQREGIELVGEEDFGKSLIARAEANTRARRQVRP